MNKVGPAPSGWQQWLTKGKYYVYSAHHDFPVEFQDWFIDHGIDINNPAFGRWVNALDHDTWHKRMVLRFNDFWQNFITAEKARSSPYTIQEILDQLSVARSTFPVTAGQ